MSATCNVCHQDWSDEEVDNDNICRYCWDKYGEDWVGDDPSAIAACAVRPHTG